jgi:hypothetical protein
MWGVTSFVLRHVGSELMDVTICLGAHGTVVGSGTILGGGRLWV